MVCASVQEGRLKSCECSRLRKGVRQFQVGGSLDRNRGGGAACIDCEALDECSFHNTNEVREPLKVIPFLGSGCYPPSRRSVRSSSTSLHAESPCASVPQ